MPSLSQHRMVLLTGLMFLSAAIQAHGKGVAGIWPPYLQPSGQPQSQTQTSKHPNGRQTRPTTPSARKPTQSVAPIVAWAEQGWTQAQREFYHFTSQGTIIMPVDWFMALEQPPTGIIDLVDPITAKPLLSDSNYLSEFGLLPSPRSALNPWGLPIGLAVAPDDSRARGTVGTTCAACHTGEIRYRGHHFRVDGSQSMADIVGFIEATYKSLLAADVSSKPPSLGFRWNRFSRRVLGRSYSTQSDKRLREEVAAFVKPIEWMAFHENIRQIHPIREGYGRTDAIGRIGNRVFGTYLDVPDNLHVANAPVNFPQLWDIWKFDWVQFDGSVAQPMGRNTGEALGVGVYTDFLKPDGSPNPSPDKWATSIHFENLYKIETQLQSLRAPHWPRQILGEVDMNRAKMGRTLFSENCANCHAPRPVLPPGDAMAKLAVTMMDAEVIGTDPQRVLNSTQARYDPSKLLGAPSEKVNLTEGLLAVTVATKNWYYDQMGFSPEERGIYDGFNRPNAVAFKMKYKAVPLDGIWATAPYLHNGSVRNIYDLLSPVNQRAKKFWVGLSDYDPILLGLGPKSNELGFEMDTIQTGNANWGHEFNNTQGPGVIGRLLSHDEKMALIEYLKVLNEMPPDNLPAVPLDWLGPYSMASVPRSQPTLTGVAIEAGTATVQFGTETDRTYRIESTSSLGPDAVWRTVGGSVTGTGRPETVSGLPITEQQTFFRVRAE
jgi:hypothetical protein